MERAVSKFVLALIGIPFVALASDAAPPGQDDVADVPSEERRAKEDEHKRYFLIGADEKAKAPRKGYKLLLVLPGGDGGADFNAFVRRIYKHAMDDDYLVAQLVAPRWSPEQAKTLVWPTRKNPWEGMEFSTEEFIADVIEDVEQRFALDTKFLFTLSWSSSGPAAYAYSLGDDARVTGSFVAMSVFKPDQLPALKNAKGQAYYILHSPEDFIPIAHAEEARDKLKKAKAEVELQTYTGGHGWRGDVYGNSRAGLRWLEKNHGKAKKAGRK